MADLKWVGHRRPRQPQSEGEPGWGIRRPPFMKRVGSLRCFDVSWGNPSRERVAVTGKQPMKVSLVVLGAVHQSLRTTFFSFGFLRLGCVSLIISWVSPLFASSNYLTTRWATLEAIHHVENPRNVSRPGSYGELGAYQFRRSTWKSHTKVPFSRAIHRDESDRVAVKHYEWLKRGLVRNGMPITPYNIALRW